MCCIQVKAARCQNENVITINGRKKNDIHWQTKSKCNTIMKWTFPLNVA